MRWRVKALVLLLRPSYSSADILFAENRFLQTLQEMYHCKSLEVPVGKTNNHLSLLGYLFCFIFDVVSTG